jgi:S-adenosylmethionine:tRNA ribosyltransferase-isomerase
MTPATALRPWPPDDRLLHIERSHATISDAHVRDLPALLAPGDLLIANDAATLPAALHTRDRRLELRLLEPPSDDGHAQVLLFGAGDHRTATEHRPAPPPLAIGTWLEIGSGLQVEVTAVQRDAPRLLHVRFDQRGAAPYHGHLVNGTPLD